MAKKPAAPKKGAEPETPKPTGPVVQLTSASTIKALLKSGRALKENLDDLTSAHSAEVREAVDKKHLNKKAFQMIKSLDRMTPEKLAATMEAFDHYYTVSGLEAREKSAPTFDQVTNGGEGGEGKDADEFEDDKTKDKGTGSFPAQTH